MSSLQKFIKKVCVQDVVYWGNPRNDGQGGMIFDAPIEIKCRWEDIDIVMSDKDNVGKSIQSRARVMVTRDLDEQGYLYLGTLDDILDSLESSDVYLNPIDLVEAYEIKRVFRVPEFMSATDFIITVYLGTAFI